MDKFIALDAVAYPLPRESVDTDQLIPARFMSRSRAQGYGIYLLHDLRFAEDGGRKNELQLDAPRFAGARILVARRNFGSGSSREAAVYALSDYGIRCVIAPSFGDIFASNATKNGVLTAQILEADAEALLSALAHADAPRLVVDLQTQTVSGHGLTFAFTIDSARRQQLLNGWDDIDLTLEYRQTIATFRSHHFTGAPWVLPTRSGD